MGFEIKPAAPGDGAELADVFLESFSDEFNQRLWPRTSDVRSFWAEKFNASIEQAAATSFIVKIEALNCESQPVIAALAKWKIYSGDACRDEQETKDATGWPEICDTDLCDRFFGTLEKERVNAMGNRPHYYLDMLGTRPEFNGRGLASKLLQWGLSRADEEKVMVFLVSTPQGKRLYERYGFETLAEYEAVPGYSMASMVRPAPV
ncbi:acyl-CoA N-acyltransferase [Aspergillus pseudodeflectus]|uniref:Acyl-CoA N-acyltransferase n=1 Tax=Aspergillus pseudodeflectus TaxID=176178 RepID=A0ABR4KTL4_9EURO